jgi:methylenetetrahydrofolate dehydrogenase (NADP+)/methenyltetrahydrofolate cyclohydrolase
MLVDGTKLAATVLERVRQSAQLLACTPHLTIITANPNFETQKYLALKKKKASGCGIQTNVIELTADATTDTVISTINAVQGATDAIVVQLPLPSGIETEPVLRAIPVHLDADALNPDTTEVLPPVVAAIREISLAHDVQFTDARVVVIGSGRLVGAPVAAWARQAGALVDVFDKSSRPDEQRCALQHADIVVSGAGVPRLITPAMVRSGVVLFDAGTSEDGGALAGDIDPACADTARLLTPVPGGIGPLTIACLLENVVLPHAKRRRNQTSTHPSV